jgi:hypothetical protein
MADRALQFFADESAGQIRFRRFVKDLMRQTRVKMSELKFNQD